MNTTRTGKIARLPLALRRELNRRLAEGEKGKAVAAWLNRRGDVQAVLAAEFGGKPIREQNLSEWRRGGYQEWRAEQEALEVAQQLQALSSGGRLLSDALANWTTGRYAVAAQRAEHLEGPEGWQRLRELCVDVVALRRGDHAAERLRLDRERQEQTRTREECHA